MIVIRFVYMDSIIILQGGPQYNMENYLTTLKQEFDSHI
jgi:hypothetical protein